MSKKPPNQIKRNSYPYHIPSIEHLKDKELKDPSSNDVWEFFRIEALLRSKGLIDLYQETFGPGAKKDYREIIKEYGILDRWEILKGSHHSLVLKFYRDVEEQVTGQPYLKWGIHDLQIDLLQESEANHQALMESLREQMKEKNSPFLWLEIDSRYPPTTILNKLKQMLKAKKEGYSPRLADSPPELLIKRLNLITWIDYFRCYDLRRCEQKTFGEIAMKVYGAPNKYEVAEHAYKRVIKLIEYAESNNWPPPPNFLNQK